MEIEDFLDRKIEEWIHRESKKLASNIELYSSGLKAKLRQSEFALKKIKELIEQDYSGSTSTQDNRFPHDEKIHFFVDTFFAFLNSTFDICAQIINQKYKLGKDEKDVNFKNIIQILKTESPQPPLYHIVKKTPKKIFFINLNKYRHCSLHRRQIYIETESHSTKGTKGYNVTFSTFSNFIQRVLCDDPFSINPKIKQKRIVNEYCMDIFNKAINEIKNIAYNI